MLLQRIMTGIILAATSLAAIFYLNEMQFAVFIGIFTTLAAWEWSRLAGWEKFWQQILYAGFVGLLPVAITLLLLLGSPINRDTGEMPFWALCAIWIYGISFVINPIVWLFGLFKLISYQRGNNSKLMFKSSIGFGILSAAYLALIVLKMEGVERLLFVLGLIWIADIGAFFVGRAFGKHKLADRVSPGKTWEGVWGALGLSTLFSLVISIYMPIMNGIVGVLAFVGLSLITVAFSIIGDLFESLVKRQMNMKDSSQLLPGHGGFLDRLDSVIAAAPIFVIGLSILSYFKLIVFAHKHTVI